MTVEQIFNYLLVRSLLMGQTSQQLIDLVDGEAVYQYFIDNIACIMQEEDFVLTSYEIIDRVSNLMYHYRFDYNKNKEINDQVNYIIGRLSDYKNMSFQRKIKLCNKWMEEESKNRGLPNKYKNTETLFNLIALDGTYLHSMFRPGEEFAIENVMEYLSLINLFLNRFPSIFDDNLFLEITKQNCEVIKSISKLPKIYLKMIHRILERLNKEYINTSGLEVKVEYYLKKKDN